VDARAMSLGIAIAVTARAGLSHIDFGNRQHSRVHGQAGQVDGG